jgi:predicted  nucleic acid-binding Zn-ribbon protein
VVAVHFHHHSDPVIERRLDRIEAALEHIIGALQTMALDFTPLKDAVSDIDTVIGSMKALLESIATQMEDKAADTAAIADLAAHIRSQKDALAQAVQNNTPADPSAVTGPAPAA